MKANLYPTYEDAARDYLALFRALMELPQEANATPEPARGALELPSDVLIRRAEEIAAISSRMIPLAQNYLDCADPVVREGIRGHFIDQATVELLLGTELIRIAEDASESTAAMRATHGAALREAISAIDKSSSVPVTQGLPTGESCRAVEFASVEEAAAALKLAVVSTASSISRRVQELGKDIAFDLVEGTPWTEVIQGASLSGGEVAELLGSVHKGPAAVILLCVYQRIEALLSRNHESAARDKAREWLTRIKRTGKIDLFDGLVESLFEVEGLEKALASVAGRPAAVPESIHKTSDQIKGLSGKFSVLAGRMRKLEDAIRLGKLVRMPQPQLVITALQVALLATLVYSGHEYIHGKLAGILRENGFL
jgi:hypothetical protein